MEEVGAQVVVSPIVIHHQSLASRFCDSYTTSKKRSLPLHPSISHHHNHQNDSNNWNPESWNWDSSRFIAKPLHRDDDGVQNIGPDPRKPDQVRDGNGTGSSSGESGGLNLVGLEPVGPEPVSRPNKRVRSGSPNYPMCQVDDCKEDLSTAKDYHRRHKVCEVHSKMGKALVGKQMQRFCQQCSRFHPLSEFDEGKRSCRRRLAGHNKRRRKTQPDETTSRVLARDNDVTNNDIINLLAVLSCAQGNAEDRNGKFSSLPVKDQLVRILNKINSLPLPDNLAAELNGSMPELASSQNKKQDNAKPSSSPSKTPKEVFETRSRPSTEGGSDSEKTKSTNLSLQLFSPSSEEYRSNKLPSDKNYLSSGSSNLSPLSSPPVVVHDLFPTRSSRDETSKDARSSNGEGGETEYVKSRMSKGCSTSFRLFGNSIRTNENGLNRNSPHRAGYTSSSGSDHSPSSLNSESQDRTSRIHFKLFGKDPSRLPGSLRTQIYNWLSNSPSEMESYIRPGCVVLSVYLSMPSSAWDQLEENLLIYVKSLVKDIDDEFWGNGRFLVYTDRRMVSHKDGKVRLCKSWRTWSTPELISVSPLAVVGGQETSLLLKGRNLTAPGTMIHCTHSAGYNIKEIPLSSFQDTAYDEITLSGFKVHTESCNVLGRFFIEVENNSRTTSFPILIADNTICRELRLLEPEINQEVLRFLNELGWLFQRKHNSFLFDYRLTRFEFLLIFSVEHDFCGLVRTLLGILLGMNVGREGLVREMLSEVRLLNRAVKRRCRGMVDMLVNYCIIDSIDDSENFIFVPDMAGPGGVTPLHLAACTSHSDDMVDALTNDPKEVGLLSWNSVLDSNGLSPYAYALMRNNHSYNALVARKLADKVNRQISLSIKDEIEPFRADEKKTTSRLNLRQNNACSRCAVIASRGYDKKFPGSKGLLQRPYFHSMLLVAAVCVCVCLFLRSRPYVDCDSVIAWENLDYGAM